MIGQIVIIKVNATPICDLEEGEVRVLFVKFFTLICFFRSKTLLLVLLFLLLYLRFPSIC